MEPSTPLALLLRRPLLPASKRGLPLSCLPSAAPSAWLFSDAPELACARRLGGPVVLTEVTEAATEPGGVLRGSGGGSSGALVPSRFIAVVPGDVVR